MSSAKSASRHIRSLALRALTLLDSQGDRVFDEVSCELPTNGIVWLRASSGGGKSQFMRLLAGLEEPASGAYLINGGDVSSMSFAEFAPWQKRIGFGFELGGLLSNKTIAQNLMLPFFYHRDISGDEADARLAESLDRLGLQKVRDRRPSACSGGSRKAACLARALITHPELLILDQPTAGLDEQGSRRLTEMLELHRAERGLRHVYIVSEDERFMRSLPDCAKLDLAEVRKNRTTARAA